MTIETTIPGKDAALETTIATMRAKLARRGFRLTESPPTHEAGGIWSIRLQDDDCPLLTANGKGATELAARAGAYAAFAERLGTHDFWRHFHLGARRAGAPVVHYPGEKWLAPASMSPCGLYKACSSGSSSSDGHEPSAAGANHFSPG